MGEGCLALIEWVPYTGEVPPCPRRSRPVNRPFDLDAARRRARCKTSEPAPSAFSTAAQREWLTPRGFSLLQRAITDGHGLSEDLAHEVARALRGWAANRGATHVAFRVHPLAGEPNEYRLPLSGLTGDDLVGGTRATAPAARATWAAAGTPWRADLAGNDGATRGGDSVGPGRLTWDPASVAYIRIDARGAVLCLPSVLASAEGEALDHRLPLMRSEDALAAAAARALRAARRQLRPSCAADGRAHARVRVRRPGAAVSPHARRIAPPRA